MYTHCMFHCYLILANCLTTKVVDLWPPNADLETVGSPLATTSINEQGHILQSYTLSRWNYPSVCTLLEKADAGPILDSETMVCKRAEEENGCAQFSMDGYCTGIQILSRSD